MEKKSDEIEFNPTALISFILVIVSGLLFPLFTSKMTLFENAFNKLTIFRYMHLFLDFYLDVSLSIIILSILLITTFLTIFFLYFLNGFGVLPNKYSGFASFLTFIYLAIGSIIYYNMLNQGSTSIFGVEFSIINLGMGIYLLPIVGIFYLLFYKQINSAFES